MNSVYCPEKAIEWIRWHISKELDDTENDIELKDALNKTERCME